MTKAAQYILFAIALIALACLSITIGSSDISIVDLLRGNIDRESTEWTIIRHLRLPRTLTTIGVGALLSLSGCIMQGLFRNPLVEPYTMGLSGGAVLGVAVTFCLGLQITLGIPAIIGFALLGGLLTMFIVLIIRRAIRCDINSMLLVGIMISFATSSITTLLMSLTTHENLSQIISWSIGSMDSASEEMAIVIVVAAIVATLISAFLGNIINALSLGATEAQHIGINSQKMIIILFVVATLMAAVSVAAVGVVAFVGMIIPHIIRRIAGHDHRYILPLAAMGGSSFMLLCDIAARTIIYPRELPSGVITGICGCIMFIYLTSRQRNEHN